MARQPLPPHRRRLRRRPRRGARARAAGWRRGLRRDRLGLRRSRTTRAPSRWRRPTRASSPRVGVHPHEAKEWSAGDAGSARAAGSIIRAWWPSGSAASTTTTCTRSARRSARRSPRSWRWPGRAIFRSRSTCAARSTARSTSCSTSGGPRDAASSRACCTATRERSISHGARSPSGSRSRSRASSPSSRIAACAASPRRCRSSGCWWRRTPRCWRPRACAGDATSRPGSTAWARCWRASRAARPRRSRPPPRATRGVCSACPSRRGREPAMSETADLLALAERLARAAGAIQRERYETGVRIRTKSAPIDLVTEVDHACEALIVETLRTAAPGRRRARRGGQRGRPRRAPPGAGSSTPSTGPPTTPTATRASACRSASSIEGVRSVGVVYDPAARGALHRDARGWRLPERPAAAGLAGGRSRARAGRDGLRLRRAPQPRRQPRPLREPS